MSCGERHDYRRQPKRSPGRMQQAIAPICMLLNIQRKELVIRPEITNVLHPDLAPDTVQRNSHNGKSCVSIFLRRVLFRPGSTFVVNAKFIRISSVWE